MKTKCLTLQISTDSRKMSGKMLDPTNIYWRPSGIWFVTKPLIKPQSRSCLLDTLDPRNHVSEWTKSITTSTINLSHLWMSKQQMLQKLENDTAPSPRCLGRGSTPGNWGKILGAPQPLKFLLTLLLVFPCNGEANKHDNVVASPPPSTSRRLPQLHVTRGGNIRGGLGEESETQEIQEKREGWGKTSIKDTPSTKRRRSNQ